MRFLLLFLALSGQAHATELFMSLGVGVANSAKSSTGEVKVGNVGFRQDLGLGFYWQNKIGFYGDGSGDRDRRSSGYGSTGLGALVGLSPIEMRLGYGVGAITTPDGYLGGRLPQFQGEVYAGVRDKHGKGLGIQYEHISSAGLVTPNNGRDFLVIQLSQRF